MTDPGEIDVVALLTRRWRVIAFCAVLGAAGGVAYALLAPAWYCSTLTVVPSQRSQDSAAMSLAARLPAGLETFSTDVQRINAVLQSTSVRDEVIKKFDLGTLYESPHIERTRVALGEHCVTSADRKSGLVSLTCEDQDPKRAMEMATYFGEVGNKVFGRVSASSAREERRFLEEQVIKARADVDDASRKLREFQEKHKIVDLPEQSKAVISAMASIKGELISKQLELSYLTSFSARTEASVMQLQQQIAIMESKLAQLEEAHQRDAAAAAGSASGSAAGSGSADFFPDAMKVPELRFVLEQLMREQKVRETVFSLMTQRFEMAKVDEARDTSTFQILDYPTLPTYRSRPKRTKIAIMGLAGGLAFAFAWIVVPVWWRKRAGAGA
jgi:capsule polysaccharide export protein KpsE/RkpR